MLTLVLLQVRQCRLLTQMFLNDRSHYGGRTTATRAVSLCAHSALGQRHTRGLRRPITDSWSRLLIHHEHAFNQRFPKWPGPSRRGDLGRFLPRRAWRHAEARRSTSAATASRKMTTTGAIA